MKKQRRNTGLRLCKNILPNGLGLLAILLGAQARNGKEEDQGDVHDNGQDVAGSVTQGTGVLEAEEDHSGADNAHEGTTGNEARCQQRATLLAGSVNLGILAAAADEPADDGADQQRGHSTARG